MIFKTVQDVRDTIAAGDEIRLRRSSNRAQVNRAANGVPPLDDEEAAEMGVRVNFNNLEQAEIHAQARRQYLNGFYHSTRFFSVGFVDDCDVRKEKKPAFESFITRKINRIMRKSREYFALHDNRFASVVAHGPGLCAWFDSTKWIPRFIPIEDFYVPTDTKTDFTNLEWFACAWDYTEGELATKVFGPNVKRGWNKTAVAAILKEYHPENTDTAESYDWVNAPEKMWELVKQNLGYYTSDAVPTIRLFHFYFKDKDGWKLRILPDDSVKGEHTEEFLYDPSKDKDGKKCEETIEASLIDHLLHCQHGDLSNKPPFLFWSERSLGFLLLEPCYWSNIMLCRLLQHIMEQFNIWLNVRDAVGKARPQMINLFDKAIIPEGVSIVPKDQRHQIDAQVTEMGMARMKQLQAEKAASYTQQTDSGTHKEQTAFETMTKMQQVNAMMSALLTRAFIYETYLYEEICRRFCLSDSKDPDVIQFQKECKAFGIPRVLLNVELWDIQPEVPSGAGNPTMEGASLKALMETRAQFPPEAQQEILQRWALLNTDPRTAERWVPLGKPTMTDGQRDSEHALGDMMATGLPVQLKPEVSPIEALEVFLTHLAAIVDQGTKRGGMVSQDKLDGIEVALVVCKQLIDQLAKRPDAKDKVKEFGKIYEQIFNAAKAMAQRLAEKNKTQNGNGHLDPAAVAKAQATAMQAQVKAKVTEASAKQKLQHGDIKFVKEQQRKNIQTIAEEQRKNAKAVGEAKRSRLKTFQDGEKD